MSEKKIALVTGANKGIGHEIAAGLGALGFRVGVGARDAARETAVAKLRAAGGRVGVPWTSPTPRASPRRRTSSTSGTAGSTCWSTTPASPARARLAQDPTTLDLDAVRAVVEMNVYGIVRVTNALLPLLRRWPSPRIVNTSSSMGSLARRPTAGPDR